MASRPIDEKIVKLSVDDANWKDKLKAAANSLTGFNNSISNIKTSGMDKLEQSTSKVGTSIMGLASRIPVIGNLANKFVELKSKSSQSAEGIEETGRKTDGVKVKFGLLAGAASVALGNIAGKAVDTGIRLAKSLTIDPIKAGFRQYEENINSVNMLTAALGKQATGEINKSLDSLHQYALTTKYSVSDMNKNLAQFVNAGIGLQDATVAIKGWGNLAASAGASTTGFAQSLQFGVSQALAMGKMTTQNWMSVENAGMATQKFKDALVEQGKAMGKNIDLSNGFRESLSQGWLTNDVFIASMQKMAQDETLTKMAANFHTFGEVSEAVSEAVETGWAMVFQNLIGGADEATTQMWTAFGNAATEMVIKPQMALVTLTQEFVKFGGKVALINTVSNAFKSFTQILESIKGAWEHVFPNSAQNAGKALANVFKALSGQMQISKGALTGIKAIFELFFNVLKVGVTAVSAVAKVLMFLIPDNLIQNGIAVIGMFANLINMIIDIGKVILKSFHLDTLTNWMGVFPKMKSAVTDFITNGISKMSVAVADMARDVPAKLDKALSSVGNFIKNFGTYAKAGFTVVFDEIGKAITKNFDFSPIVDFVNKIKEAISSFTGSFNKGFGGGLKSVSDFKDGIIKNMKEAVSPFTEFPSVLEKSLGKAKTPIEQMQKLMDIFKDSVGTFGKVLQETHNPLTAFAAAIGVLDTAIGGKLIGGFSDLSKSVSDFSQKFPGKQMISDFTGEVKKSGDPLKGMAVALQTLDKVFGGPIVGSISDFANGLAGFKTKGDETVSTAQKLGDVLRNFLTPIVDAVKKALEGAKVGFDVFKSKLDETQKPIDSFVAGLKAMSDYISKGFVVNLQGIGKTISTAFGQGFDLAKEKMSGFTSFIQSQFPNAIKIGSDVVNNLGDNFGKIGPVIVKAFKVISDAVKTFIDDMKRVTDWSGTVGGVIGKVFVGAIKLASDALNSLVGIFSGFIAAIQPAVPTLKDMFSGIMDGLGSFLNTINNSSLLKGGIIIILIGWLKDLKEGVGIIGRIKGAFSDFFGTIGSFGDAKNILEQVKDTLKAYETEIKAQALLTIAGAVAVLAASLYLMSKIKMDDMTTALAGLAGAMTLLAGTYAVMNAIPQGPVGTISTVTSMIAIAISLGILAKTLNTLADIDPGRALTALGEMVGLAAVLVLTMAGISLVAKNPSNLAAVLSMIAIAGSLYIMGQALSKIGDIDLNNLGPALGGMAVLMGGLAGLMIVMSKSSTSITMQSSLAVYAIAASLKKMADAVVVLGGIDTGTLIKGLSSIGVLMLGIVGVSKGLQGSSGLKGAATVLALAAALNMIVVPVLALGSMPLQVVAQGILAMAAAMGVIAAMSMMASGSAAGAVAILAMAIALNMIIAPIMILGSLPWQTTALGIGMMAAAFAVFLLAGLGATAVAPGLLALSAAMLSFSLSVGIISISLSLIAFALTLLLTSIAAFVAGGVAFVKSLGEMLAAIGNLGPQIGSAVKALATGLIEGFAGAIESSLGTIIDLAINIIDAVLEGLITAAPKLANGAVRLVTEIIKGFMQALPEFVVTAGNGIMDAMNQLAMFIENNADAILHSVAAVFAAVLKVIAYGLADILGNIPGIGGQLKSKLREAGDTAAAGLRESFPSGLSAASKEGADASIKAIAEKSPEMRQEVMRMAEQAKDGGGKIKTYLSMLGIQGADEFVKGIKSGDIPSQQAGALLASMTEAGAKDGDLKAVAEAMGGTWANGVFTPGHAAKDKEAGSKHKEATKEGAKTTGADTASMGAEADKLIGGYKASGGAGTLGVAGIDAQIKQMKEKAKSGAAPDGTDTGTMGSNADALVGSYKSSGPGSDSLANSVTDAKNKAITAATPTEGDKAAVQGGGSALTSGFAVGIGANTVQAIQNANNVKSGAVAGIQGGNGNPGGVQIGSTFASGLAGQSGSASAAGAQVKNSGSNGTKGGDGRTGGSQIGLGVVAGIQAHAGGASAAGTSVKRSGEAGTKGGDGATGGNQLGQSYVGALQAKSGEAGATGSQIKNNAQNNMAGGDASASGSAIGSSFVSGLSGWIQSAANAASNIIQAVKDRMPHSPAPKGPMSGSGWKTVVESGGVIAKVFADGIRNGTKGVEEASGGMISEVQSAIMHIQNALDDNMDFEPTIKPVVDLDGINDIDLEGVIGAKGADLRYNMMNASQAAIANQRYSTVDVVDKLGKVDASLQRLYGVNTDQLQAITKSGSPILTVDGNVMNKQLAPGMAQAQSEYNNMMDRLSGVVNFD